MHNSNLDRFWETTKSYWHSDKPLAPFAAATHVVSQMFGLDPVLKDVGRAIDRNKGALAPYEGIASRTRMNVSEVLTDIGIFKDSTDHQRHFHPVSALTKVINVVGDGIADAVDYLAGTTRGRVHHALVRS